VSYYRHQFRSIISQPLLIASGVRLLKIPLSLSRYVALKFLVAELTGKNREINIYRHLASRSGTHPGSEHVPTLLDHFKVQGVNGEHDVLVLQVTGPQLEDMFEYKSSAVERRIKSLTHQVALGLSFLHDCGVVHAGNQIVPSAHLNGNSQMKSRPAPRQYRT